MVERVIGLTVTTEPHRVFEETQGVGDSDNLVAIFWTGIRGSPTCSKFERVRGFVAVYWGTWPL